MFLAAEWHYMPVWQQRLTLGAKKYTGKTLKVLCKIHKGSQVLMPLFQSDLCLQEIRCCCSRWDDPFRVRHCPEELRLSCVGIFENHDGGDVAAAIAVVGSRPHGDQLLIEHELVAFMDKLMRPADQLQVVDVNKLQGVGKETQPMRKHCTSYFHH